MKTDNHNLRENISTNEKYIVRKMGLKFQNPEFNILRKIACYTFFFLPTVEANRRMLF